jgi:hypothetical protein
LFEAIGKRINMQRFLPGVVKRGVKAIGSRVIDWLREWTRPDNHGLVGGVVADATRSNAELMLENALLRQQLIVVSRQVKRPIVSEYVTYFNQARPHQDINQRIPCASHLPDHTEGEIVGVPVLGGLHHDYRRKAA